jgi:hypothetical protein
MSLEGDLAHVANFGQTHFHNWPIDLEIEMKAIIKYNKKL